MKSRDKNVKRRIGSLFVTLLMLVMSVYVEPMTYQVQAAGTDFLNWAQNDTMDNTLDVVSNKAGDDDILLELDAEDLGQYSLVYYLEDGERTTVTFDNEQSTLDIALKVDSYSTTSAAIESITQDLVDSSYAEMDYTADTPEWTTSTPTVNDDGELEYSVENSSSNEYPGIAIQLNNHRFYAKWDFQEDIIYVYMDSYSSGTIMPVTYTEASDSNSETLYILKGLEDFDISPTYLVENDAEDGNEEMAPIVQPSDTDDQAGTKPGLDVTFKLPKTLDTTTWEYVYDTDSLQGYSAIVEFEDIATSAYMNFKFALGEGNSELEELPEENTDTLYSSYDSTDYTYEVLIVQDKSELFDPTGTDDNIIVWEDLASSTIYEADINFQEESDASIDIETMSFEPETNYAYTYLEFYLQRSDSEEAYLILKPYDTGSDEELEYRVLYSETIEDQLDEDDDLWLQYYQTEDNAEDEISIPIPFKSSSFQDVYQVIVNFADTSMYSQVLNYRAADDTDIPPATPQIEEVDRIYTVPSIDEESDEASKVQFDLTWDAIENDTDSTLDDVFENDDDDTSNDAVYYEVLINDMPSMDIEDDPYQVFRVFKMTYNDTDGQYEMSNYFGDEDWDTPFNEGDYTEGYDADDGLIRMGDIVLFDKITSIFTDSNTTPVIDTEYDNSENTYTVTKSSDDIDFDATELGVYYLRLRVVTEQDGEYNASEYSVAESISFGIDDEMIPIPDNLSYEATSSNTGLELTWDAVDISDYEDIMLNQLGYDVGDYDYRVFISEDKDSLTDLSEDRNTYQEVEVDETDTATLSDSDLSYLRETFTDPEEDADSDDDDEERGNVIYFDVDPQTPPVLTIDNLDENQTYYIRIRVDIDVVDSNGDAYETRSGDLSEVLSTITSEDQTEPGDDTLIPVAPEDVSVSFVDEDTSLSTQLDWTVPDSLDLSEDQFGFEVVAVENTALPSDLQGKSLSLEDIQDSDDMDDLSYEMWRIYDDGTGLVLTMSDETDQEFSVIDSDSLDSGLLTYDESESTIKMIDEENAPNSIQYYYVRSINIDETVTQQASSWVPVTITTSPVQAPTNLSIVTDYEDYDSYYEAVIEFDVAVDSMATLASDYNVEIFVKGEDDDDYVEADVGTSDETGEYAAERVDSSTNSSDTLTLEYLISGLDSGTEYYFKVRLVDKSLGTVTLPDGTSGYPTSAYSNRVSTRTDFSQDDYDEDTIYQDYIDYYLEKADELKKDAYFTFGDTTDDDDDDDDDVVIMKYRDSYGLGLLESEEGSSLTLAIDEDAAENIYYLPSDFVETANDENVTLVIQSEDQGYKISLSPDTIGADVTDQIDQAVDAIDDDSSLEDYYVRITVISGDYDGTINSYEPSSPLLNISADIVNSDMSEDDMDDGLIDSLNTIISLKESKLIDELETELDDDGIDEDALNEIVQDILDEVADSFRSRGETYLENQMDNSIYSITELNKKMTLQLLPEDTDSENVLYSQSTSGWEEANSSLVGDYLKVQTTILGSFITVYGDNSELEGTYTSDQLKIMSKYDLYDIFSDSELEDGTTEIKGGQVIQTFARLLGADTLYDTSDYLEEQDIDLPYMGSNQSVDRQTVAYVYVQVYLKKKRMNISAVTISNYNAIDDISSVDSDYRQVLLKGVNLGILPLDNGQLDPTATTQMSGFFDMIESIEE